MTPALTYLDTQQFLQDCVVVYLDGEEARLVMALALAGEMELA